MAVFVCCTRFLCNFVPNCVGDGLSIERNLLISVLKLTQNGSVKQEVVYSDAHVTAEYGEKLLQNLQTTTGINLNDRQITADTQTRLCLATQAAQLGADLQQMSLYLDWREFEALSAIALQLNGYTTTNNIHFSHNKKRWEIDVVGCRKPLVVCIDCKHWQHGMHPSAIQKAAQAQIQRTHALAHSTLKRKRPLAFSAWTKARFIPVALSLLPYSQKFCEQVPIVPVLQLQDFISQLPLNLACVCSFEQQITHL